MKILLANNFHFNKGGADAAYLKAGRLLEANGHEVAYFSTINEKNEPSRWQDYFVSYYDLNGKHGLISKLKIAGRIFYNNEARKKIGRLIDDFKPDIVHLHNIYHHLSPSIIGEIKKRGIPMVMTLHDYKLVCPNYKLFNKGKYCEKCLGGKYYNCFFGKCVKKSYLKSFLCALEGYWQRHIIKSYLKIDLFISPSRFLKEKLVRDGVNGNKISVIPNCVDLKDWDAPDAREENYLLYYGRLSEEKGIETLIGAILAAKEKGIYLEAKIVGSGPEALRLSALIKRNGLSDRVELSGPKYGSELKKYIHGARAVIIPSIWPENMPLTLIESMAAGKTVIAARSGGISEVITSGVNGILFNPGEADDLLESIISLAAADQPEMNKKAKDTAQNYSSSGYYENTINAYFNLMKS